MLGGVREQQEQGFCLREDKLGPRVTTAQITPLLARAQSLQYVNRVCGIY